MDFGGVCGNGNTTEDPDLETKAVLQRTGLDPAFLFLCLNSTTTTSTNFLFSACFFSCPQRRVVFVLHTLIVFNPLSLTCQKQRSEKNMRGFAQTVQISGVAIYKCLSPRYERCSEAPSRVTPEER